MAHPCLVFMLLSMRCFAGGERAAQSLTWITSCYGELEPSDKELGMQNRTPGLKLMLELLVPAEI